MGIFLILLGQVVHKGEGMIVRYYGKKYGDGGMFFNAVICLFSAIFFLVTDKGGLYFPKELLPYGLLSCLLFAVGFYTMYLALRIGSYALTMLISSFASVISVIYGVFILHEPTNVFTVLGVVLVFISIFLMNYRPEKDRDGKPFSWKWLTAILLCALANGFIGVLKRAQQLRFDKACDNEFMLISLIGSFLFLTVLGFVKERANFARVIKTGFLYGMLAGLCNGANNFLGLLIFLFLPISISTPVGAGLGLIFTFAVSLVIYKEKFTRAQAFGAFFGALSAILSMIGNMLK